MGCCGEKRSNAGVAHGGPASPSPPAGRFVDTPMVLFEYAGPTSLTAQGPVTGARYQFPEPGRQVAVDGRDAPFIAGVPNLKRVPR